MRNTLISTLTILVCGISFAAAPYTLVLTWQNSASGPTPAGYNFYINDCAATGATGTPAATIGTTAPETLTDIITADGVYQVCIRALTAKPNPATDQCPGDTSPDPAVPNCETADPGLAVKTLDLSDFVLASPAESLDVQVLCPNGGCTVIITP